MKANSIKPMVRVRPKELKQIVMLGYLTDSMLEKVAGIVDLLQFEPEEMIFRQNDPADRFYMLSRGHVLLEQKITDRVTACVGSIKPGYSFGWSAMIEDSLYTTDARCIEVSEVFSFRSEKIRKLCSREPEIGYRIYQRLLVILKKRYDYRTEQFRQAIINHPDMQDLLCT